MFPKGVPWVKYHGIYKDERWRGLVFDIQKKKKRGLVFESSRLQSESKPGPQVETETGSTGRNHLIPDSIIYRNQN